MHLSTDECGIAYAAVVSRLCYRGQSSRLQHVLVGLPPHAKALPPRYTSVTRLVVSLSTLSGMHLLGEDVVTQSNALVTDVDAMRPCDESLRLALILPTKRAFEYSLSCCHCLFLPSRADRRLRRPTCHTLAMPTCRRAAGIVGPTCDIENTLPCQGLLRQQRREFVSVALTPCSRVEPQQ
jgi:hypothetical protein